MATPPSDSSQPKKSRARGLAVALAGLGLVAAGSYLAATGYRVEPGKASTRTSCTTYYIKDPTNPYSPGMPYQSCIDIPVIEQMPKAHTAQGSAGVALAGVGVVVAIFGFRHMR